MYRIVVEDGDRLVSATLAGLMTVEEVERYMADLGRALRRFGAGYGLVIDVHDCPIQTQAMIEAMGVRMGEMPKARAIAVITDSSLSRMQIKRLFTQPYTRIVPTVEAGRAWVLHGAEPRAAA